MREAVGYLADDGTFYETEAEAKRHDHANNITAWCDSHKIKADSVFQIIHSLATELRSYINADQECKEPQCNDFHPALGSAAVEKDQADDGEGKGNPFAVFEQSSDGH